MGDLQSDHSHFLDIIGAAGGPLAQSHGRRVVEHVRGPSGPLGSPFKGAYGDVAFQKNEPVTISGAGRDGRRPHGLAYRNSRKERGSLVVLLTVTWLPIFAIFGVILCLRIASLHHLKEQRTLDRCLFPILRARCTTLVQLSETNQKLKMMIHALAISKAAQKLAATNPYTVGVAAAMQVEIAALIAAIKALVKYQDGIILVEKVSSATIVKCGVPLKGVQTLAFERPFSLEATLAEVPAPLGWSGQPNQSELEVRSWKNLTIQSYGYCRPEDNSSKLDGEDYGERFRHAPDNQPSKPSFF